MPTNPTKIVLYQYNDSQWGDLLTSYNGRTFSYDGIGNLTNDGIWTYTWKHGRELASMTKGSTTWYYVYNADGLRIGRSNRSTAYQYVYNNGLLSQMTVGNNTMYITYDANGCPFTLDYNGVVYYYVLNAFGDVIGIADSAGILVTEYMYDAWGKQLTCTGSNASTIGTLNPLRYRSYIYDVETGLYYLQSRYYNPEIGRFINADGLVSTGQGLLGNNMFAYCHNNPITWSDPCGTCLHRIDFWKHCDECKGKSFGQRFVGYVEESAAVHRQSQELDTIIRMEQIEIVDSFVKSEEMDIVKPSSKMASGAINIYQGAKLLFIPDPTPTNDIMAIYKVTSGIIKVCWGGAELLGEMIKK